MWPFSYLSDACFNPGVSQFVQVPPEISKELKSLLPNAKKPKLNYPDYPLTAHGQLMMALIQSNIYKHPHPLAIMQFFEAIGRYGDFFRTRKEYIGPVLDAFIGPK
jgi:exportin-T